MSFLLVPELPRFGNDKIEELFAPGSSPALQRHMREEEIGLVALSCHSALDVRFLSMDSKAKVELVLLLLQPRLAQSVLVISFTGLFPVWIMSLPFTKTAPLEYRRFGRENRGSPDAIPDGDEYTKRFASCSRVRVLLGGGEFPEGGSLHDLSELVRNGKIGIVCQDLQGPEPRL